MTCDTQHEFSSTAEERERHRGKAPRPRDDTKRPPPTPHFSMCGAREAPLFLLKSFELWFRAIRAGLSGMSSDAACCWGCLSLPLMLLTFCLIPLFWASDDMGAGFDMPACLPSGRRRMITAEQAVNKVCHLFLQAAALGFALVAAVALGLSGGVVNHYLDSPRDAAAYLANTIITVDHASDLALLEVGSRGTWRA